MRNRLFVNALKSVGLVTSGDDPEATVTFWKSHDETEMLSESDDTTKVSTSAGSATVEEGDRMPVDLSAIEDVDLRKSIEDAIAEKDAQITELQAELTPEPDPVEKASDEVKAILKAQEEELAKVRDDLQKERATRRKADFMKRAERLEFIGKADEMAPVLDEIEAAISPESYEKLESALQTANNRVQAAANQGLFKELGTEEGAEGAYEDRRDAWVEKNRKDDEPVEVARARFLQTDEGRQAKQELRS